MSVRLFEICRFLFVDSSSLAGGELLELALDRLLDDPHRVRVALGQGLGHHLGLFEADVRRQQRHFGVGPSLDPALSSMEEGLGKHEATDLIG